MFSGLAASILAVSLLSFWPFHQFYETFNNGLDASRWRTPVDRFLAIHGLFLFIIVGTFLVVRTRHDLLAACQEFLEPGRNRRRVWGGCRLVAVSLILVAGLFLAVLGYWNAVLMLVAAGAPGNCCGWRLIVSPEPSRPYEALILSILVMATLIVDRRRPRNGGRGHWADEHPFQVLPRGVGVHGNRSSLYALVAGIFPPARTAISSF